MHGILGDFALQSEFIFLFELCHGFGIILCKFEVGFCRLFVSAHGLSDCLFQSLYFLVAIGDNAVGFFDLISFLARIEREFEVVRLGAPELEVVDLVLHFSCSCSLRVNFSFFSALSARIFDRYPRRVRALRLC